VEYETCVVYGRKRLGDGFPSFLDLEFLKEPKKKILYEDRKE
jgi:hypothetical protein